MRNRNRQWYAGRKKRRGRRKENQEHKRFNEARWEERQRWREKTHHAFPSPPSGIQHPEGGDVVVEGGLARVPEGEWHWTGCDDNVGFGFRIARDFIDWKYLQGRESQDIRSIVMLWNNEAGRRVSKSSSSSSSSNSSSDASHTIITSINFTKPS